MGVEGVQEGRELSPVLRVIDEEVWFHHLGVFRQKVQDPVFCSARDPLT